MKHLKDIVVESFFDDDIVDGKQFEKVVKEEIKRFLKDNYKGVSRYKISRNPNEDSKYVVDCNGNVSVKNYKIVSLTNNVFIWGNVRSFHCACCDYLTSLEGAPKEVSEVFSCDRCESLTSLEGTPKKVGGDFLCRGCNSLTSLEGAPKEVSGSFYCSECESLTSLEGAPEEVGKNFDSRNCKSLTSLKGAPKEVGGSFYCHNCESLTSLEGAPEKVGGNLYSDLM